MLSDRLVEMQRRLRLGAAAAAAVVEGSGGRGGLRGDKEAATAAALPSGGEDPPKAMAVVTMASLDLDADSYVRREMDLVMRHFRPSTVQRARDLGNSNSKPSLGNSRFIEGQEGANAAAPGSADSGIIAASSPPSGPQARHLRSLEGPAVVASVNGKSPAKPQHPRATRSAGAAPEPLLAGLQRDVVGLKQKLQRVQVEAARVRGEVRASLLPRPSDEAPQGTTRREAEGDGALAMPWRPAGAAVSMLTSPRSASASPSSSAAPKISVGAASPLRLSPEKLAFANAVAYPAAQTVGVL